MDSAEVVDTATAGFTVVRSPLLDMNGVATWMVTSHRHVRRMAAERRIPYVRLVITSALTRRRWPGGSLTRSGVIWLI